MLHQGQTFGIDQAACLIGKSGMQADNIGGLQQLLQWHILESQLFSLFVRGIERPCFGGHADGFAESQHFTADVSSSDDADLFSAEGDTEVASPASGS